MYGTSIAYAHGYTTKLASMWGYNLYLKMKKTLILVLLSIAFEKVFPQDITNLSKHSCESCYNAFLQLKSSIVNRKIDSTLSFFTDSMRNNYRDFEGNSLKKFITLKWMNSLAFITSLKKRKYELSDFSENKFSAQITVDFKKRSKEDDGDNRIVYFLDFEKINNKYKIRFIDFAD